MHVTKKISIKVHKQSDLKLLYNLVADAPEAIKEQAIEIVVNGARVIARDARILAPVRTGFLRRWIWSRRTSYGAGVYASAPYSYFVEKGHLTAAKWIPMRFIPGQFFMKNSFDANIPWINRQVEQAGIEYFASMTGSYEVT